MRYEKYSLELSARLALNYLTHMVDEREDCLPYWLININTFPVVSLGMGLGVDYGLYIVSRIMEFYKEEKDLKKSVLGGVTTAGRAVFFTATMMTVGVIFWWFSPLRFQAEMGLLLGILMMVNMLVGVLVLMIGVFGWALEPAS